MTANDTLQIPDMSQRVCILHAVAREADSLAAIRSGSIVFSDAEYLRILSTRLRDLTADYVEYERVPRGEVLRLAADSFAWLALIAAREAA